MHPTVFLQQCHVSKRQFSAQVGTTNQRLRRIDIVKVGGWIKIGFTLNKGMVHHGEINEIIIMLSDDMGNGFRHGEFGETEQLCLCVSWKQKLRENFD